MAENCCEQMLWTLCIAVDSKITNIFFFLTTEQAATLKKK